MNTFYTSAIHQLAPSSHQGRDSIPQLSPRGSVVLQQLPDHVILDTKTWLLNIENHLCTHSSCQGTLQVTDTKREGSVITLYTCCSFCEKETIIKNITGWGPQGHRTSGKRGPAIHPFNLACVAAAVLNGGTFTSYERGHCELGLGCLTQTGYRRSEKETLNAVKRVEAAGSEKRVVKYQSEGPKLKLDLGFDCSWTHTRNAPEAMVTLIHIATREIIHQKVLSKRRVRCIKGKEIVLTEGNYVGTSHGMEGEGFRWCVDWLDKKKILPQVKRLACDRDSSVGHTLAIDPRLKHIKVCFDPGHTNKNIVRDIHAALKKSIPVAGYAKQIGQWIMTSIKNAVHYTPPVCPYQ